MPALTPQSFRLLPEDGAQFEALISQLLTALDYRILEKPAVGVDGGRDVLVERTLKDQMGERRERVVVQCKHHAHSGKPIGDRDVGVWENAMKRHRARGYLLVTDTRVTENLSRSFREYTSDEANYPNWASFWDVDELIALLNGHAQLRDSFFPSVELLRTPLDQLANEVRCWLSCIRYEITDSVQRGNQTIDMLATLKQGTIKQRIFIRCIGREVRTSDVETLSRALRRKKAQGWLISDKQVSKKARLRCEQMPNIEIHSLADILRGLVWGPYLDKIHQSLEAEKVGPRYVDASCYTVETSEQGHELNREIYDSLDAYVDDWISEPGRNHISVLGEFGIGKTWFALHYASKQLDRFLNNPVTERFPLLITLRSFTKATTAQQLINDALLATYGLPFIGGAYDVFQEMNNRGKLLLLLDGFDEMAQRVDYQTVVSNFWEMAKLVSDASKVILTSRTEYFRRAIESERLLAGAELVQHNSLLDSARFDVLYIEDFDDERIRNVIIRRLGKERGGKVANDILNNHNLSELARKPLLIQLLLAILDQPKPRPLENQAQVYLYATNKLLLRNIVEGKTFLSTAHKLYFLCELAWELIKTGEPRIHYSAIPERIGAFFGSIIKDKHELDSWDYDLRNQTLLRRNAAGYYEFAHKSLAEYFVAFKFAGELGCLNEEFSITYLEQGNVPCKIPYQRKSATELSETFGSIPLRGRMSAVRDFLTPMSSENSADRLWKVIESSKGKTFDDVRYVAGNCLTLLGRSENFMVSQSLDELSLAGAVLNNLSLHGVTVKSTSLDQAELQNVDLAGLNAEGISFRKARLSNVSLAKAIVKNADFTGAIIDRWEYIYSLSFSPDGTRIASSGDRNEIAIWDVNSGGQLLTIPSSARSTQHVSFSPSGETVAAGGGDGICRLLDSITGQTVWQNDTKAEFIRSVAFHPNGSFVASTGEDRSLTIFESESGKVYVKRKLNDEGLCVAFSLDGKLIAVGTRQGSILVFDTMNWKRLDRWRAHESTMFVSFSSSNSLLLTGGSERSRGPRKRSGRTARSTGTIAVWNVTTWNKVREIETEYNGGWMKGSVSSKGPHVAAQTSGASAAIWNFETGELCSHLKGHHGTVFTTLFSPDGELLATCSRDGSVRLWSVSTGRLLKTITTYKDCVGATINHPKGLEELDKIWLMERGAKITD